MILEIEQTTERVGIKTGDPHFDRIEPEKAKEMLKLNPITEMIRSALREELANQAQGGGGTTSAGEEEKP